MILFLSPRGAGVYRFRGAKGVFLWVCSFPYTTGRIFIAPAGYSSSTYFYRGQVDDLIVIAM